MNRKSPVLAAILGFLFNGFGIMYVSVKQGLFVLGFTFIIGFMTLGIFLPAVWIGCGFWGYLAAKQYNEEQAAGAEAEAREHARPS